MSFSLHRQLNENLPRLAWLATVSLNQKTIKVTHGSSVECRNEWIVEGVWDDDFDKGNFHQSEHFFGSGIRLKDDSIYFVPSSALVDRLLYCKKNGEILVSNSLIVLLAATDARLDDKHDYQKESLSILNGVDKYDREFTIKHPVIECFYQVFYENIVVTEMSISFQKRGKRHKVTSFDQYYEMLSKTLSEIKKNYQSDNRTIPVSAYSTLSSGYDSTAVSCLAKDLGVKTFFTGNPVKAPLNMLARKKKNDDGVEIAKCLDVEVQTLNTKRSSISQDELYFLSTNYPKHTIGAFSEISFHSMASYIEKECSAAVVFTGYHGDKIWDANTGERYLSRQIIRGDMSGLNLSEIRLKSGFINLAVPFILARDISDIVNISRNPEMEPWRLHNAYDRPIPRRISERAGVKRHLFGNKKTFIANKYIWPINTTLRRQFFRYIKSNHRISHVTIYIEYIIHLLYWRRITGGALRRIGIQLEKDVNILLEKDIDLYFLMCHWAMHKLANRTAKFLGNVRQSTQL